MVSTQGVSLRQYGGGGMASESSASTQRHLRSFLVRRRSSTRSGPSSGRWFSSTLRRGGQATTKGVSAFSKAKEDDQKHLEELEELLTFQEPREEEGEAVEEDEEKDEKRGKRKERRAMAIHATKTEEPTKGACYGCGASLQVSDERQAGFVEWDVYETKKKYKQLNQVLCQRCHLLCNGKMVPGIADWGTTNVKAKLEEGVGKKEELLEKISEEELSQLQRENLLTPEALRAQLLQMKGQKNLVLHLVDLTDIQGTFLRQIRDLVSKNPILIVGTKFDLLPKGSHVKDVSDWLMQYLMDKGLNPIGIVLVSSKTRFGIRQAATLLKKNRKGRDIVVIGAANVGKSAFIRSLLNEMSSLRSANYDLGAAQIRHKPVESDMPGTTLGIIPLQAFKSGGVLHDTPGLHLDHRMIHMVLPNEVKKLLPRKPLRPYIAQTPASILIEQKLEHQEQEEAGQDGDHLYDVEDMLLSDTMGTLRSASATYFWGDVARLDLISCPMSTHVVFFGSNNGTLRVRSSPLLCEGNDHQREDEEEEEEEGEEKEGIDKSDLSSSLISVKVRGGLEQVKQLVIQSPVHGGGLQPIVDICVSGVPGWITLYTKAGSDPIEAEVYTPKGVQIFLREPFPIHCIEY